jgi:hypothetical protein
MKQPPHRTERRNICEGGPKHGYTFQMKSSAKYIDHAGGRYAKTSCTRTLNNSPTLVIWMWEAPKEK